MPPKLTLGLEEQGYGTAAHHDAFAEGDGLRQGAGGREQPDRNTGSAPA